MILKQNQTLIIRKQHSRATIAINQNQRKHHTVGIQDFTETTLQSASVNLETNKNCDIIFYSKAMPMIQNITQSPISILEDVIKFTLSLIYIRFSSYSLAPGSLKR